MEDIPVLVETNGTESLTQFAMIEETPVTDVGDLDRDLSIIEADALMPIAIVGMGFRGPGEAKDVNKLWEMLIEGKEAWKSIPRERWNNNAFHHPDHSRHGTINVEGGHFLEEDVSLFDAPFFNMTSDEAAAMDPQQRLLLEVTYEGLENAGITLPQFIGSKTSCFVGSFSADYTDMLLRDSECVPMYQCTNAGQSRAMAANRVSYFYDLKGPSVTVDTACSGSLVALHLACQSLQTGDASMAVAAGVNLILSHEFMSTMSMMRFLSPDGRCYTFDERANGYARGEAIGCLILKPLADALRDQSTIRAIIRGTGSNQDGRTPGITLPSGTAQGALIRDVYSRAKLDPEETQVIEAHGTGTQAGDPIETGAIARVFGVGRSSNSLVRIGSIKTNVGHLEGASGIAGVIKAVLMLENRVMLPSRNFNTPNPRIHFDEWNLKVQLTPEPWVTLGPHRVSVNSFGYGGSNVHVIVEDALGYLKTRGLRTQHRIPLLPPRDTNVQSENHAPGAPEQYRVFMISAFDEASCSTQINGLREYLRSWEGRAHEEFMNELAFTLNEHRSRFMWKTAVVGRSIAELTNQLSSNIKIRSSIRKPTLGFVFTGQGAQWAGMGKELLHGYPVFRESIAKIDHFLSTIRAPFSVYEELTKSEEDSQLSHPLLSQTICTALQIALVDLLSSWGIHPDSVTGHSSGEIAAAYACHALGIEEAMVAAYYRGLAASQLLLTEAKGSMMAIGMSAGEVQPYLSSLTSGKAVVACINSPTSVTVSGDAEAIRELGDILKDMSVFSRRLAVDVAYHSHHMELVAQEYLAAIEHIRPLDRRRISEEWHLVPFFSSVTGTELVSDELGPQYWVSNLLGQVKFADSLKALCFETRTRHSSTGISITRRERRAGAAQKPSVDCLLEVGPHSALSGPIKQILADNVKLKAADILYASVLSRQNHAAFSALQAASTLASLSYPVDLQAINVPLKTRNQRASRLLVDLPPYSWNHSRSYWAEPRLSKMFRNREHPRTDLLGAPDNMACPFEPRWRNYLRLSEIPWMADHKIQSDIVFPAAGYLSIAIEGIMQIAKDDDIAGVLLQDVSIQSALIISETAGVEIMTSLLKCDQPQLPSSDDWYTFHIYSVSKDNKWTGHCTGLIALESKTGDTNESHTCDQNGLVDTPLEAESQNILAVDIDLLYENLRRIGLDYGPCFANLSSAHTMKTGACLTEVTIPDTAAVMPMNIQHPLLIHPCTLDSTFHAIFAALPDGISLDKGPLIPIAIESMRISRQIKSEAGEILNTYTRVRSTTAGGVVASIEAANGDDAFAVVKPRLSISGLRCIRLDAAEREVSKRGEIPIAYCIEWKPDSDLLFERDGLSYQQLIDNEEDIVDLSSEKNLDHNLANLIEGQLFDTEAGEGDKAKESEKFRSALTELLRQHTERQQFQSFTMTSSADQRNLPGPAENIIREVVDHLTALLKNDEAVDKALPLWNAYNEYLSAIRAHRSAARHLQLTGYKRPGISVLEICQDDEDPSTLYLEPLTKPHAENRSQVPLCSQYTFGYSTDSSTQLSEAKFAAFPVVVTLTKFDIASESTDQQSSKTLYDVIILKHSAASLTSNSHVLTNIKALLNPSGYLMIVDHFDAQQSLLDAVTQCLMYFWPAGIFDIPGSTEIDSNMVEQILGQAGFTTRKIGHSSLDRGLKGNVFICRLKQATELTGHEYLIITENGQIESAIEPLHARLLELSPEVSVTDIHHAQPENKTCIVLGGMQERLLASLEDDILEILKRIFLHSAGVLWVTKGGAIEPVNAEAGLIQGFARTARSESNVKSIITLDLDVLHPLSGHETADLITDLIKARFLRKEVVDDDTEYAERNGTVLIPRVVDRPDLNKDIVQVHQSEIESDELFQSQNRPLRLVRANARYPLPHFEIDTECKELPPGFVEVEVMAFGVNEAEIQDSPVANEANKTLGLECSGRINAVGPGVQDLTVGDRVNCLRVGTARTKFSGHESTFHKVNDNVSYELAAAIPVAYSTAYYVVHHLTWVGSEEIVLIDDAAGWIGSAIAEMCLLSNATVFATVKTSTQRDDLVAQFRIPPEQILVAGVANIAQRILEITNDRKADVVIGSDHVDSQHMRVLQQSLAPFGRFVQLQTYGKEGDHRQDPASFVNNGSLSRINIFELFKKKKKLVGDLLGKVMDLFNEGTLRGLSRVPVYSVTDNEEAMRVMASEKHIVITADQDAVVNAMIPNNVVHLFKRNVTYLLIGGLGGIGRAIALWMADHGAKHLILVNRSGLSAGSGLSTVDELRDKGVQVTVQACDIANEKQVREMLLAVQQNQPPIRGVIHGAMILKDVHIERMTTDDYHTVLGPRCHGTLNLHKYLPSSLDFFVLLSSISGIIGNATQAAYAAGSAFMDAFAAYRNRLGLPAVSLDLGTITDVGYLTSNKELLAKMEKQGFQGTDTKTLLSLVRVAIMQSPSSGNSQIVTGLGEWKAGESLANFDEALFSHFRRRFQVPEQSDQSDDTIAMLKESLRASKTLDEAIPLVFEALRAKIAALFAFSVNRIDSSSPLSDFGVDSHVAVELRNWISKVLESSVSILEILASGSVLQLAAQIASRSRLVAVDHAE